ncbi:hypothetical protein [Mesorhizobium sp. Root157]|uniref:hypothetical protein n=1 Tax=Mesorhizobium sp. Root157 TaxID=1736477 RepID=UPI0012E3EB0B|nr:hypothetical protein [Mesorhizobium sp. Root157]
MARILICLLSGLLLAGGGCARTDDGTVVIPRQIDARRIWDKGPSSTQTPPVQSGANVFPVVAPPPHVTRRRSAPGTSPAPANEKTVSCGTVQQAGQRVRVVCQ